MVWSSIRAAYKWCFRGATRVDQRMHVASDSRPFKRRSRQLLQLEPLERREVLDDNGLVPLRDARLTLSFAPDGTSIAGAPSSLFALAGQLDTTGDWQLRLASAFQTWARESNGDIGVVADDGTQFGVPGASRQDPRFGDIRLGARPLASGVAAISMPLTREASGTWLGDVLFNSNYPFASLDELFAVAVHEAGNVFGLADNNDPASPLHAVDIPASTTPTANDLADLQRLYGTRLPDLHETAVGDGQPVKTNNDEWTRATKIQPLAVSEGAEGSAPSVVYGDIQTSSDVDYFIYRVSGSYSGPMTLRLRTAGLSLLQPSVTVSNSQQIDLDTRSANPDLQHDMTIQLPHVVPDQDIYIEVGANETSLLGVGGYALIVILDTINQVADDYINEILARNQRDLSQEQLNRLVSGDNDLLDADGHTNDDADDAIELSESGDAELGVRFEIAGSIESVSDVDFYKLKTPESNVAGFSVMHVEVTTLQAGRLVPVVQVLNEDRVPLNATTLVNSSGEVVLQIVGVESDKEYFVAVSGTDHDAFARGDYRMSVIFDDNGVPLENVAQESLNASGEQHEHLFYVATAQLVQFVITVPNSGEANEALVVVEVRRDDNTRYAQFAAKPGTSRSSSALLLLPGEYHLSLTAVESPISTTFHSIEYLVQAATLSETLVVGLIDPNDQPFNCTDPALEGAFCYPNGTINPNPFLWTNGFGVTQDQQTVDPFQFYTWQNADWWAWYLEQTKNLPAPAANTENYRLNSNSPIDKSSANGVLQNDVSSDDIPLVAVLMEPPQHGSLVLQTNGAFTYIPNTDYVGPDSFVYQAFDYRHPSAATTVTLDVFGRGDLSFDGIVNAADIDILSAAIRNSLFDARFDVNGDGQLDLADHTAFLSSVFVVTPGDANVDGQVDSRDWLLWNENRFQHDVGWSAGDFNGDGMVDGSDFGVWLRYRFVSPAAAQLPASRRSVRAAASSTPIVSESTDAARFARLAELSRRSTISQHPYDRLSGLIRRR